MVDTEKQQLTFIPNKILYIYCTKTH